MLKTIKNSCIIFILFLMIFSCQQAKNQEELKSRIQDKIETNTTDSIININLGKISNLDFEEYIILPPYTQIEEIERTLHLNLSNVSIGIENHDYFNTIILLERKESIGSFDLLREYKILNSTNVIIKKSVPLKIEN